MLLSQIKIRYQRQLMRDMDGRVRKQWKWKVSKKTFKFWPVYRDIFRAHIFLDNHRSRGNQTPMYSEFDLAVRRQDPARSATAAATARGSQLLEATRAVADRAGSLGLLRPVWLRSMWSQLLYRVRWAQRRGTYSHLGFRKG